MNGATSVTPATAASARADVLVHGATGVTGRRVCAELARRGIRFDVSGRNDEGLTALVAALPGNFAGRPRPRSQVVESTSSASLEAAITGRRLVVACAGPFSEVGEPLISAAARLGVHYMDTAGEQSFVAHALTAFDDAAKASGACVAPAMGFEVALADWMAQVATARLEGQVENISVCYVYRDARLASLSRGTLRSLLSELAAGHGGPFVDGALRREGPLAIRRRFAARADGGTLEEVTGLSCPSPESVVTPSHTGATTVRTYVALPGGLARVAFAGRALVRPLSRVLRAASERAGPATDAEWRPLRFEVIVEAARSGVSALARACGRDPYAVTSQIQAFAVEETLAGRVTAKGVVAPSVAFDSGRGLAALEAFGLEFDITERSRER